MKIGAKNVFNIGQSKSNARKKDKLFIFEVKHMMVLKVDARLPHVVDGSVYKFYVYFWIVNLEQLRKATYWSPFFNYIRFR